MGSFQGTDGGGGCHGHDDKCPERSVVLLAMVSGEFEKQTKNRRGERGRELVRERQGSAGQRKTERREKVKAPQLHIWAQSSNKRVRRGPV